jgi:ABC-2 type transport system permease protein
MSSSVITYTRFELVRTLRNRQSFIFALVLPAVLFLAITAANRNQTFQGIDFPTYYMTSMAGYGAMIAALAGGARIAAERAVGWTRQLRLTPLRPSAYFRAKLLTTYLTAILSIALLYICGAIYGVHLAPVRWLAMTGLILIGLAPFAAIGILLGHVLTIDAMGPAMGGMSFFFGILGGQWFPLTNHAMQQVGKCIPSYWLTQAAHIGVGGSSWGWQGWTVIVVWTAVFAALAARSYRRDQGK